MSESQTAVATAALGTAQVMPEGRSLWADGIHRLKKDKMAMFCLWIVVFYATVALLAKFGVIATPWDREIAPRYSPPSLSSVPMWMGTDIFGYSVFYKMIHGTRIAMSVGLVSCMISIPVGVILGAIAG